MPEALARWREFCNHAERIFGPDWRSVRVGNAMWSGRLGDQWVEFGLMHDPDNPPPSQGYGVWQINNIWGPNAR